MNAPSSAEFPASDSFPRGANGVEGTPRPADLSLLDFLDRPTLQQIQDTFTSVTRLRTTIRRADGTPLTDPTDPALGDQSNAILEQLISTEVNEQGEFAAPIRIGERRIGSISVEQSPLAISQQAMHDKMLDLGRRLGLPQDKAAQLATQVQETWAPSRAAAVQFMHLLADSLALLCHEKHQSQQRVDELTVLYHVSRMLSGVRKLQKVLDTAVESIGQAMDVKAVCIRLLSDDKPPALIPRAVYQLSEAYLEKGRIELQQSPMFQEAIAHGISYVADMRSDPRVLFHVDARREGLVSMLCAPLVFHGRPIGTIQVFTRSPRAFSEFEQHLLQAIAQLLATAIERERLDEIRREGNRMARQLHLAADVQRRMMPNTMPQMPPLDIAARYVPSLELSGDFFDFLDLSGHLGVVVGDVVGKGVPASLMMASVRASLRAFSQDLYDINEIMRRVNHAMTRDTQAHEFATLWYGVLDPVDLRLTYCNAGHEPPLLLRDGQIRQLDVGGMIIGVMEDAWYDWDIVDLHPGDVLLIYTDGLSETFNFDNESFGRARIEAALREAADQPAQGIVNHVLWQLRRFTGIRQANDDLTLVAVKVDTQLQPLVAPTPGS